MTLRGSASMLALVSALLGSGGALALAAESSIPERPDGLYPEAARELAVVRAEAALAGGLKESPALRSVDDRRLSGQVNMNRHASTHLNYEINEFPDIKTWYSEIIPKHSSADTYFSVLGHRYGYFGLQQVEAAGVSGYWFQGKIVFSIWDMCDRDQGECPADELAEVVECGKDSVCTSFGGEGTGAKTYMDFHEWGIEQQYALVTEIFDEGGGKVRFDGYFYAGELGGWQLLGKLRVSRGKIEPRIYHMYSFVEQWSEREFDKVRFARFGPAMVEEKTQPDQWHQIMEASWRHTDLEETKHVAGNVTHGGTLWGMGMGGDLVKNIESGTKLKLTVPWPANEIAPLNEFEQARQNNALPTGCLGGTCAMTKVKSIIGKAFQWKYAPITFLICIIVLVGCLQVVQWCCRSNKRR